MVNTHTFHIPVMGLGYTADSPLKVAQYGIDSVISIVDDFLLEKLRKYYSENNNIEYKEITTKEEDYRAKRVKSYLDMVNNLAEAKFDELKSSVAHKKNEIVKYFEMLPDSSEIKKEFFRLSDKYLNFNDLSSWIKENLRMGSIDVNIMTKIDNDNYKGSEKLPTEFNDAHAALRGFALSNLESSLILSAGMNPRLYSYMENFDDFYPDEKGYIKKKIVLKVSDYRSAFIQGRFLAKKGLWVSEYRVESGLNCGGHAFATDGFLMGPILSEFKEKRAELKEQITTILNGSLASKNRIVPENSLEMKITAQGGVGTAEEHDFLIKHYELDSVGWGSPFLLVPEATSVDNETLIQLAKAGEEDLYLSNISPLGVPFNNLKGASKDLEKLALAEEGKPGSPCPKKFLIFNREFSDKNICTASIQYQNKKIDSLQNEGLSSEEFDSEVQKVIDKSCLCIGLSTSTLKKYNANTKVDGEGVLVCPGPNMAYFDQKMSLKEMVGHIYGRINMLSNLERPNMFVKELNIYLDYLKNKIEESRNSFSDKHAKHFDDFVSNLEKGMNYYNDLFSNLDGWFQDTKTKIKKELVTGREKLENLKLSIEKLSGLNEMAG